MFSFVKKAWNLFFIFVVAIIFSYFLFFLFIHPLNMAFFLGEKLSAAVGVTNTTSVPVNPINQLALQLNEKEKQLSEREQSLNDRSAAIEKQNSLWGNGLLLAIFLALAILGFLLIVNFYFDRKRERELEFLEKVDAERIVKEEAIGNS